MKKLLIVALLLNAALLTGRLWQEMPANAQEGGGDPACEQDRTLHSIDSNADGTVDLSDAVHLLTWLFLSGPEPQLCLAGASCPSSGYPHCPPNELRFMDHGDDTFTDTCTGLMWQKPTADINGDGQVFDSIDFVEAVDYVRQLTLGGHEDWRLPTAEELISLLVYNDPAGNLMPPLFREVTGSGFHWSSSRAFNRGGQWAVNFGNGSMGNLQQAIAHVRAVRTAP